MVENWARRGASDRGLGMGGLFLRGEGRLGVWEVFFWREGFLGVDMYVCSMLYIHNMNEAIDAKEKWKKEMSDLWPAAKGSLARVYKPCIRKNCPACARGDKHPAWLFAYSSQGRRKVMYVPLALVPQIQQAIQNGREIEKYLYRTGPELIKRHRLTVKTNPNTQTKS